MKDTGEQRYISTHSPLRVFSFMSWMPYLRGKFYVPSDQEVALPAERVWTLGERNISRLYKKSNHDSYAVRAVTSHCIAYGISTLNTNTLGKFWFKFRRLVPALPLVTRPGLRLRMENTGYRCGCTKKYTEWTVVICGPGCKLLSGAVVNE